MIIRFVYINYLVIRLVSFGHVYIYIYIYIYMCIYIWLMFDPILDYSIYDRYGIIARGDQWFFSFVFQFRFFPGNNVILVLKNPRNIYAGRYSILCLKWLIDLICIQYLFCRLITNSNCSSYDGNRTHWFRWIFDIHVVDCAQLVTKSWKRTRPLYIRTIIRTFVIPEYVVGIQHNNYLCLIIWGAC